MKLDERKKVAIALGYYARATDPEAKTLSAAIEIYALAEYRNDVDCQLAFRKGYQQAEEHVSANGKEARELRELIEWIQKLEHEVVRQRQDIYSTIGYLKRQAAGGGGSGGGDPAPYDYRSPMRKWQAQSPQPQPPEVTGFWYMQKKDSPALFCQSGKPVHFSDYALCKAACDDLRNRMGIDCEPKAYARLLGSEVYQEPKIDGHF